MAKKIKEEKKEPKEKRAPKEVKSKDKTSPKEKASKEVKTKEVKPKKEAKPKKKNKKKGEIKKRSKRYQELKKQIKIQRYNIAEAVKLAKQTSTTKFEGSIELHVRLGIDMSKSDQHVRGSVMFPHSTGKKIVIACFVDEANKKACQEAGADIVGGQEMIDKIKETKKCDFDIAVAEPKMMPKIGQIAKILGPKGLMPNPKNQTVTPTPAKTVQELKGGKAAFKHDANGIIHLMIGKASFDDQKLIENYTIFIEELKKLKPEKLKGDFIRSITICSTMGPGIKVKF